MKGTTDCAIVGGGVIGLSIARRLSMEGLKVTLLERGACGGEASWAGAGVLAPCNPHRRDELASLRQKSLEAYPAFCQSLLEETGIDSEYEVCGELELALDDASEKSLRSDILAGEDIRGNDGSPMYVWHSPESARRLEPSISFEILGAMESRATAQVRNPRLLKALRVACENRGVTIRENCEVKSFLKDGDRIQGVVTGHDTLAAKSVVLCAGAWSDQLDPDLAARIPLKPVRGQMILMKFNRRLFNRVIARGKTYLVPRRDGHVVLGATEEHDSGFERRTTAAGIAGLLEKGVKLVPMINDAQIITTWAGLRPKPADDMPYIGPVQGFLGLIAATGHFRAGLILAPVTAESVARCVLQSPN